MNWSVFEYAGPTALAWTALWTSAVVFVAFLALFGWLVWRGARNGASLRKRLVCLGIPVACVVTYLCAWWLFGPFLDRAWRGLQTDVRRRSSTYTMLTFASAFLPLANAWGIGPLFLSFAAFGGVYFATTIFIPETKGKTLEEIEALLDKKAPGVHPANPL